MVRRFLIPKIIGFKNKQKFMEHRKNMIILDLVILEINKNKNSKNVYWKKIKIHLFFQKILVIKKYLLLKIFKYMFHEKNMIFQKFFY